MTLLIAGSLIAGSYTIYLPFFLNAQHNSQQTQAYYMARGAIERGQLAVRYHPLWFAWSGWEQGDIQRWPTSDNTITHDINITKLSWATNNQWGGEKDNKLYVHKPTKIYLGYDDTNNTAQYYQDIKNYVKYPSDTVSLDITIPVDLKKSIWEDNSLLCDLQDDVCDIGQNNIHDDTIVKRNRKWQNGRWNFIIIPYTSINRERLALNVDYANDTNIRESTVNQTQTPTLIFADLFNPLAQNHLPDAVLTEQNISGAVASGIQDQTFSQLLTNNNIQYNILWLDMVHNAIRRDGKIYPYIQYRINTDTHIATPMNTIQAYAEIGNTIMHIQTIKPNTLTQQKWSFKISN